MKKKKRSKKGSELTVSSWVLDGFVGILALMIYNFCLYLLAIGFNIPGIVLKLESAMGYFLLNSFIDFGFTAGELIVSLIIVFLLSFLLGVIIGALVRKTRK